MLDAQNPTPLAIAPHARPHPPQFVALLVVLVSQPVARSPSQSSKPALQTVPHTAAVQTPAALVAPVQTIPQRPQFALLVLRLASQPLARFPSQSPKPGLHARMQRDPAHNGVALAPPAHTVPQDPQFVALLEVSKHEVPQRTSGAVQPLTQRPPLASHVGVMPEHVTPQAPQLAAVSSAVSQPFAVKRSQSPKPARHMNEHRPVAHRPVLFGGTAHGASQPPQCATLVLVSTQVDPHRDWPAGHIGAASGIAVTSGGALPSRDAVASGCGFTATSSTTATSSGRLASALPEASMVASSRDASRSRIGTEVHATDRSAITARELFDDKRMRRLVYRDRREHLLLFRQAQRRIARAHM